MMVNLWGGDTSNQPKLGKAIDIRQLAPKLKDFVKQQYIDSHIVNKRDEKYNNFEFSDDRSAFETMRSVGGSVSVG